MFKHFKLIVSVSILALATSVYVYSQGRTTIDGLNPQLPAALGANGGLKVEGIAAGVAQPSNITQFAGTNVVTGVGPTAAGVPRFTTSKDNLETTGTLNANGLTFAVVLAGFSGVGFNVSAACTCVILYEYSWDNGTTWAGAFAVVGGVQQTFSNNPAAAVDGTFIVGSHWTNARLRVSSYTSGTPTVYIRATQLVSPLAVGALQVGVPGSTIPTFVAVNGLKAQTGVPTAVTNSTTVNANGDVYGVQFIRQDHPNRINCVLTTTNTTSTLITGCAAPGAGLSIYLTDVFVYGGVAVGATAAATIQSGTGGTCGTGTAINYYCQHVATDGCEAGFMTPKKIAANSEVCLVDATVGTKFVTVGGYIAP
jgi:hypothetical protein